MVEGSFKHLADLCTEIYKHRHLLTTDEIYEVYSINKQLLPLQYAPIAQRLHTIVSRVSPEYVERNQSKGEKNKTFKKSVSDMQSSSILRLKISRTGYLLKTVSKPCSSTNVKLLTK